MKKKYLALLLFAAGSLFAQVSLGVRIGPPPPPRVLAVRPIGPGGGSVWLDGYWYTTGGRYRWHQGYWTRPPYIGANWVGPRHDGQRYYAGYWDGNHGRVEHDHHTDRNRERDYRR